MTEIKRLKALLELERLFGMEDIPKKSHKASEPTQDKFLEFRDKVLSCTKCPLHKERTQVVFGVGSLKAKVVFVGEAPGEEEDQKGEPFVGRAGRLLTKVMMELGVSRDDVYIANIIKCRPTQNRTPQYEEIVVCIGYLFKQIEFIKPLIVCALGAVAAGALLNNPRISVSSLRGRYYNYNNMRIFVTFHPSYILRNMSELGRFESDLRTLFQEVGLIRK